MTTLDGKIAVITGAAGNIGAATARLMAGRGARIVAVDRPGTDLSALTADLPGVVAVEADITDEDAVRACVSRARELNGRIDILFNNAGLEGPVRDISDYDLADFRKVLAVNVEGVFLGLKHVLPVMLAQGAGSVVNCSSVAGLVGAPGMAAYVASKHAVVGLTRAAALEVAATGVRVTCVNPGPVHGRMMGSIDDGAGLSEEARAKAVPARRYGRAEEVAALVAFLASDEAAHITGSVHAIDGGLTAV